MSEVFLVEDHDKALKIWRKKNIQGLDLVHLDAHIDFGFHPAEPIERIINKARSIKELKRNLEYSLVFLRYEKDFDKQTDIGNYIYPAMEEGIVKDFYWVIPGRLKEFKQSLKIIKGILQSFSRQDPYHSGRKPHVKGLSPQMSNKREAKGTVPDRKCNASRTTRHTLQDGIIATELLGRKFVICTLEKLPVLEQRVLLDIDTDFLVTDSLLNATNTAKIGKRKCWIRPERLAQELRGKIFHPLFTTIAYSVNGGFTPMRYKALGDELAYRLSPKHFAERFRQRFMASVFFERFASTGKKEYYQKAIKLDPAYRTVDNNYGPLYLSIRKFSRAKKEFSKIVQVDPKNPYPFLGLGTIALEKGDFYKAKRHFSYALSLKRDLPQALFGLAQAEFRLKNFKKAKDLFCRYQSLRPLQPQSYYFLGQIYERERNFEKAAVFYQDALRLGLNNIAALSGLLRISSHIQAKDDIIQYIIIRYKEFKRQFFRAKRLSLQKNKKIKNLSMLEKKMASLERNLERRQIQCQSQRFYVRTPIW